jgi:hypothetical protein
MKFENFEDMKPLQRREFLKALTLAFGIPGLLSQTRKFDLLNILVGEAHAQSMMAGPSYFLEVNFRDQWDFGNLFVAPSIAKNYSSVKSRIAVFEEPISERRNFYLTSHGQELRPHLDTIAVLEVGECPLRGTESVHGHEAGNPLRSPGRSKTSGAGRIDMATSDKRTQGAGNEILFSSTPTPLILHNFLQKQSEPSLTNGLLLRSSVRSKVHTFYHFEANLANAQVDRFFDKTTFLNSINKGVGVPSPSMTLVDKYGTKIAEFLKKVDSDYMRRVASNSQAELKHQSHLDALKQKLSSAQAPVQKGLIALSPVEVDAWSKGIGPQLECPGDDSLKCQVRGDKMNIGEMFGYVSKLFTSGQVRSVGIDYDVSDVHNNRTPFLLNNQAQQTGLPLARLIQSLKDAGIYDDTVIAMYTLDGSRSPLLNSTGDGTKNAIILAGGKINGGYYGDVAVEKSAIRYFRPDDNGNVSSTGATDRTMRVPAADIYKTVMTAAKVPMGVLDQFPDVKPGKLLNYLLR